MPIEGWRVRTFSRKSNMTHLHTSAANSGYFLDCTQKRLEEMARGNSFAGARADLSMRTKECWETRPSPSHPHHWTPEQFEDFLVRHRYPANTIRDRIAQHRLGICERLMAGAYVPQDVLNSEGGQAALADACMHVRAQDEAAFKEAQTREAEALFEQALQLDGSGAANQAVHDLLIEGVKLSGKAQGADLLPIHVAGYPRALWCIYDHKQVMFKDSAWHRDSCYGVVFRMMRVTAESIVRQALLDKRVTMDETKWFFGPTWQPFIHVQKCSPAFTE